MPISAAEVQELRKISGAGMMECKSALTEANGDVQLAFKLLREKGIAKAEKKSSRDANEGLIGIKVEGSQASIIEINSETDFVSRNSEFHNLVNSILDLSMLNLDDNKKTLEQATDLINDAVAKIGENIVLKRVNTLKGNISSYVHNAVSDGMGKIGVLLSIESEGNEVLEVGKNICMHIAASNPTSISPKDLDKTIVNNEKEIIEQQMKDIKKADNIIKKMIEGKLNKFYDETTLLRQNFVIDPSISVEEYLKNCSDQFGFKIEIKDFVRFEIGS